jgi:Protein of unknown function (DUF2934)
MSKTQRKKKAVAGPLTKESSLEAVSTRNQVSADAVAVRAYELFVARGCADGHALDDWIEAEKQLEAAAQLPDLNRDYSIERLNPPN